ncbi:MAG: rRNA maturation RNase YbeY [Patescibacteria group bacterium]
MKERAFSIQKTVRGRYPTLPFEQMKEAIVGTHYTLTLVFTGAARSRRINKTYRGKATPANVLSFPYSKKEGEILIAPDVVRREARQYGYPYADYLARMFIHGLFHLKGYAHGSIMESKEERMRKKFSIA